MNLLISKPQKATYERHIHQNILSLSEIIKDAKIKNHKNLFITLFDFEKAFDRVSHEWILKVLETFNFPKKFINFIFAILQEGVSQVILPNGNFSKGFQIKSGVRQGDTISPLLFVLSIEPIIRAILNDDNIKGYKIPKKIKKLFPNQNFIPSKILAYADDVTFIGSLEDLNKCIILFNIFCEASGAKLNFGK